MLLYTEDNRLPIVGTVYTVYTGSARTASSCRVLHDFRADQLTLGTIICMVFVGPMTLKNASFHLVSFKAMHRQFLKCISLKI